MMRLQVLNFTLVKGNGLCKENRGAKIIFYAHGAKIRGIGIKYQIKIGQLYE